MMTPQQAFLVFAYADWVMLIAGIAAIVATIGWCIYAIFPRNKGRRRRVLLRALKSFLVFALFYGTQCSVLIWFVNQQLTPLLIVLFALPVVVMLAGLIASIAFGVHAILRRTGKERRQVVLKALLGVLVFGVGVAPHTAAMLLPLLISAEDHANEDHTNHEGTLTHIGEPAPDFELTTIDGTPFRTVDLRGRVIVLNFFATWCGPCQMELPHLQAIWNEFRNNDDFRMLVVGREESDDSVKAFQQEHGFTFPMASDQDASIYNKFASQSIPRTYLISRQGTILYQWTGGYEEEIPKLKRLVSKELGKKK
jgi:peroxiredoxin